MDRADNRIDLNLFRVLDAIYSHGGVSAAARVRHLTQPAVTHALQRLRDQLGDPLFVRQGNRLLPTEKVRTMMPAVQLHLKGLHASAHAQPRFDPAQLDLELTVGFRDILESIALPSLLARIEQHAPLRGPGQESHRDRLAGTIAKGKTSPAGGRDDHRTASNESAQEEFYQSVHRAPNDRISL